MRIAIVALIALACASAARAQPELTPEAVIAFLDANGDGAVDRGEFLNAQRIRFAQFDTNANGQMSIAEFKAALDPIARQNGDASFHAFDADHDNRLSSSEYLTFYAWVFDNVVDKNHDQVMTLEEFRSLRKH
jgi:Ca2+-binding EF-hand superfamily protein